MQEMITEGILKVIYIHVIQLNLSTMATWGTEKNGHCRESETRVIVWTVRRKKNCRCREVAVSGDWTVVDNRKERPYLVL